MNERIKEILSQCQLESIDGPEYPRWTDLEKFAELIVRECIDVVDVGGEFVSRPKMVERLKQHFRVE